jgi:FdhD protein
MPGDKTFDVIEIDGDQCQTVQGHICEDRPVRVFLNGKPAGSFETCPGDLESLARGFLICEGLVADGSDIESVKVRGADLLVQARAGGPRSIFSNWTFTVDVRVLLERYCSMDVYSPLRRSTGGNHSAAIFTAAGGAVAFAEDAQRQGCLYKVVGKADSTGYDPAACFLMSTGRVSPWMVHAVRLAGMPLMASFGGPSAKAVEAARGNGLTLVTIVGLARAIIYSGPGRISGLPGETSGHENVADAVYYR